MEKYNLSIVTKTLTISKAFEDAVAQGDTDEYALYLRLIREIPGLTIVRKTHKSPTKYRTKSGEEFSCNQFKNLTYENMKGFIKALPNSEKYLEAYHFLKNCGSLVQTNRYTLVRKWFMAQFPDFRKNPLFYFYNDVPVIDIATFIQGAQEREEELAQPMAEKKVS
jgi:hypothetical protein